jgi:hypothetical protein
MCHRPLPKSTADDASNLRGKKRVEHMQSLASANLNSCSSDGSSSGGSTGARGFDSHGSRISCSIGHWFSTFSDSWSGVTAVDFLRTGTVCVSHCIVQI